MFILPSVLRLSSLYGHSNNLELELNNNSSFKRMYRMEEKLIDSFENSILNNNKRAHKTSKIFRYIKHILYAIIGLIISVLPALGILNIIE